MKFGDRYIEAEEPVLYFENISMSMLTEQNRPTMARGGFGNMPRVIWDNRSEVQFQMVEGVLSNISMSMLLSANVTSAEQGKTIAVHKREGPLSLMPGKRIKDGEEIDCHCCYLQKTPILNGKKAFIFEYANDVVQTKLYGVFDKNENNENIFRRNQLSVYTDKECTEIADMDKEYVVDYYYEYGDEALIYTIQKERFNGLFTLEGKFYSKDENKGRNYTNIIYMPKVRVVSNIGLRLGERADPTVSTFNIIGLPENVGDTKNLIVEITHLNDDIDGDI